MPCVWYRLASTRPLIFSLAVSQKVDVICTFELNHLPTQQSEAIRGFLLLIKWGEGPPGFFLRSVWADNSEFLLSFASLPTLQLKLFTWVCAQCVCSKSYFSVGCATTVAIELQLQSTHHTKYKHDTHDITYITHILHTHSTMLHTMLTQIQDTALYTVMSLQRKLCCLDKQWS